MREVVLDQADVIIVGAGHAGLVAAEELGGRGKRVIVIDQKGPQNLGGQAHWSLGGLFMVDTPEQRRRGIRDSRALAMQDWLGSAQFDREEDALFAAGEVAGFGGGGYHGHNALEGGFWAAASSPGTMRGAVANCLTEDAASPPYATDRPPIFLARSRICPADCRGLR